MLGLVQNCFVCVNNPVIYAFWMEEELIAIFKAISLHDLPTIV